MGSISVQQPVSSSGAPTSIQITLQPTKSNVDTGIAKQILSSQKQLHITPTVGGSQPKIIMTQPSTIIQQQLAVTGMHKPSMC